MRSKARLGECLARTSTSTGSASIDRPMPIGVGAAAGWVRCRARRPRRRRRSRREASRAATKTADAVAAGPSTNLSAVLEQLASQRSGESTRLAVILSDGRHNDVDARGPAGSRHAVGRRAGVRGADRQLGADARRAAAPRRGAGRGGGEGFGRDRRDRHRFRLRRPGDVRRAAARRTRSGPQADRVHRRARRPAGAIHGAGQGAGLAGICRRGRAGR